MSGWSAANVLGFYTSHRHSPEDLYPSERAVLLPVLAECDSVLDVGCAAGGFSNIFAALKPGIRYVGLDGEEAMIAQASHRYPHRSFQQGRADHLPFADQSFDLVFCTGVLLHNPDFEPILRECYRVAAKHCVVDLPRVSASGLPSRAVMRLSERFPDGAPSDANAVPYTLADPHRVLTVLQSLRPAPRTFSLTGYSGQPGRGTYDSATQAPVDLVYFCVLQLGK